jgi:hypothetical protein
LVADGCIVEVNRAVSRGDRLNPKASSLEDPLDELMVLRLIQYQGLTEDLPKVGIREARMQSGEFRFNLRPPLNVGVEPIGSRYNDGDHDANRREECCDEINDRQPRPMRQVIDYSGRENWRS